MTPEQRKRNTFGWYEVAARKKGPSLLVDLTCHSIETLGPQGRSIESMEDIKLSRAVRLSFGLIVGQITRGPRKGEPKWAKGCKVDVVVERGSDKIERAAFEAETGLCGDCVDGVEVRGWSAEQGPLTQACRRCQGSGKASSSAPAEAAP